MSNKLDWFKTIRNAYFFHISFASGRALLILNLLGVVLTTIIVVISLFLGWGVGRAYKTNDITPQMVIWYQEKQNSKSLEFLLKDYEEAKENIKSGIEDYTYIFIFLDIIFLGNICILIYLLYKHILFSPQKLSDSSMKK